MTCALTCVGVFFTLFRLVDTALDGWLVAELAANEPDLALWLAIATLITFVLSCYLKIMARRAGVEAAERMAVLFYLDAAAFFLEDTTTVMVLLRTATPDTSTVATANLLVTIFSGILSWVMVTCGMPCCSCLGEKYKLQDGESDEANDIKAQCLCGLCQVPFWIGMAVSVLPQSDSDSSGKAWVKDLAWFFYVPGLIVTLVYFVKAWREIRDAASA
jgi:hypothetical protein